MSEPVAASRRPLALVIAALVVITLVLIALFVVGPDSSDAEPPSAAETTQSTPDPTTADVEATAPDPVYIATSSSHARLRMTPDDPPPSGSIQTSLDGVEWTEALATSPMLDVAVGAGLAVAVGLSDDFGGAVHTSTDGLTWGPQIEIVDSLVSVAYGEGTWVAVGNRSFAEEGGAGDASEGAIYRSEDGESWQRVAVTSPYDNPELADLGELLFTSLDSVAYGAGTWIATATECATRICSRVTFTSTDTENWERGVLDDRIVLIDMAHDGEQWGFVGGEPALNPADSSEVDVPIGASGTSPDGHTWTIAPTEPDRVVLTSLARGDNEWLAVTAFTPTSAQDPPPGGGIYRSSDLRTWEQIGTADEWTWSIALWRPAAESAPVTEVGAADAPPAAIRITTAELQLLDAEGTPTDTFAYADPATTVIEALTAHFGEAEQEFAEGDHTCTEDTTANRWAGLYVMYPGTDPTATDWSVYYTEHDRAGPIPVLGPNGAGIGLEMSDLREAYPHAPTHTFSHEGMTLDFLYLDVQSHRSGEVGVELNAQDGVVTWFGAPRSTSGGAEC